MDSAPRLRPRAVRLPLERGSGGIEQDDAFEPAAPDHDRRRAGEAGIVRREIDGDPLEIVERAEHQPPGEAAAVDVELPGEAAGIGAQRARGPGARDVDRRHLDQGRLALRQQDRAVSR